jgi:hypothetical protein
MVVAIMALPGSGSVQHPSPRDQEALEAIENQWLNAEYDRGTLERILADDFVHPVSVGTFLTKKQHIEWVVSHPPPVRRQQRFDKLQIRTYGNVGIVTGIVIATYEDGRQDRTIFTDVFVRRNGAWQAINAQENSVQPMPAR